MKILRALSTLPTWQKVVIAAIVIAVPAGMLLGPIAYRWFTQSKPQD
jgi:hypothetical protein